MMITKRFQRLQRRKISKYNVYRLDRQFFDNGNEGLEAIKVRSGRFIGCFHNVISIFRLIPEVKTSE